MTNTMSPFHRFQGWRILALFAVFAAYTLWYIGPGYFGQMTRLTGHLSLQEMGFYSGATAVYFFYLLHSCYLILLKIVSLL